MNRQDVTRLILDSRTRFGLSWATVAQAIGRSEVWTTAACHGQAPFSSDEATKLAELLQLPAEVVPTLTEVPYRGTAVETVPRDPTIYRLYEIMLVYGETIKALIHEKFGDGIMSAIDFEMDISRKPDPKGDRVVITLDGKFLPYRKW